MVGALVVDADGVIVGRGAHEFAGGPHAEINALAEAGDRAQGATLYCTLEPCVMCAGALVSARVARLVFGARDLRFGGVRSKFQLADSDILNHRLEITEAVLAADGVVNPSEDLLPEWCQLSLAEADLEVHGLALASDHGPDWTIALWTCAGRRCTLVEVSTVSGATAG